MRDGEMVAAIVAGDPAALGDAYDQYAPALYAYGRSMLAEPSAAADAVYDTFIVAAAKLYGLRDPSRLRPWLYAVARNECHRLLRSHPGASPFDEAPGLSAETAAFGWALEQLELKELVYSALAGLSPADREIIELTLRHEFYGADLADALGVPRNQAHALATRARTQFETGLSALMVARSGQGSCPELAEILTGWQGELSDPVRKEVARHISSCPVCGEHRRQELSPVALLAALTPPVLPASLRYQVLGLLTDPSPDAVQACADVAIRAEPFTRTGFPEPLDPLGTRRTPVSLIPMAGVLVAACAVVGGGAMLVANTLHHQASATPVTPAIPTAQAAPAVAPSPSAHPKASSSPTGGAAGSAAVGGATSPVAATTTKKAAAPKTSKSASPSASPSVSPSPSASPTRTTPPPATSPSPSPSPSTTPPGTPSPPLSSSSSPPTATGGGLQPAGAGRPGLLGALTRRSGSGQLLGVCADRCHGLVFRTQPSAPGPGFTICVR